MYLLLIGTERCCDVVMMLLLVVLSSVCGFVRVCVRVCVCGGDGCVGDTGDTGDTTNACTMYRVMGVCGCGCPFGRQDVRVVDRLMYSKPFYF